jgi:hypothetical protein
MPGFAFAAVAGVPILMAGLSNDGHSDSAVATGNLQFEPQSG